MHESASVFAGLQLLEQLPDSRSELLQKISGMYHFYLHNSVVKSPFDDLMVVKKDYELKGFKILNFGNGSSGTIGGAVN